MATVSWTEYVSKPVTTLTFLGAPPKEPVTDTDKKQAEELAEKQAAFLSAVRAFNDSPEFARYEKTGGVSNAFINASTEAFVGIPGWEKPVPEKEKAFQNFLPLRNRLMLALQDITGRDFRKAGLSHVRITPQSASELLQKLPGLASHYSGEEYLFSFKDDIKSARQHFEDKPPPLSLEEGSLNNLLMRVDKAATESGLFNALDALRQFADRQHGRY